MQVIAHTPGAVPAASSSRENLFQPLLLLRLGQHLAYLRQDRHGLARRQRIVEDRLPRMSPISIATQRRNCSQPRARSAAASSRTICDEHQHEIPRGSLAPVHEAKSCSISTRNGVGSAASKSKRDTCTEPEGSCTMRDAVGFGPSVARRWVH